jgi:hypothetical protein
VENSSNESRQVSGTPRVEFFIIVLHHIPTNNAVNITDRTNRAEIPVPIEGAALGLVGGFGEARHS